MRYSRWDSALEPDIARQMTMTMALWELAPHGGHPAVDALEDLVVREDFVAILRFEVQYDELPWFIAQALRRVLALYTKRRDLSLPGVDPRAVAKSKFIASERLCSETNHLFRLRRIGALSFAPRVEGVLSHAARKISSILGGEIPSLGSLRLAFGPGATTSVPKRTASPREKLGSPLACSVELFPAALVVLKEIPAMRAIHADPEQTPFVDIHNGKVQFVPKSAKEHRAIVVEPILNTLVQGGVGRWLQGKLRRSGVDIRDQTRNHRLARQGSIDGSLATVDLSSASDTVSTELVYELLPVDFASWLARARTGSVELDGEVLKLEKFSSMGNGFTFPLETLIFYALAWGVCVHLGLGTGRVNAYGDDIILPTEGVPLLFETLRTCGFVVNEEKSYSSGPFRESCGKDYYLGIDIRPVYLRGEKLPGDERESLHVYDLFRLHNFYFRDFAPEVCRFIRSYLDESIQLFGPDGYGDGHLLSERWERRRTKLHAERGYAGYVFDTFSWKPRKSFKTSRGDRALASYSTYVGASEEASVVREYRGTDFAVTVPGRHGVNRISIYTFA